MSRPLFGDWLASGKDPTIHKLPFRSIEDLTISTFRTGSSFTCNPPVEDTDVDYLVLTGRGKLDECGCRLDKYAFRNCFEDWVSKQDTDPAVLDESDYAVELENGVRFSAWRRGNLNLIVTDDVTLYMRSVAATLLAKELNLMHKHDRINLFRCIKFAEEYEGPLP